MVLCDQPLISSQALGALSTSEDSQVVEGLRVKVEPRDRMRSLFVIRTSYPTQ